jgi:hypothetical protein
MLNEVVVAVLKYCLKILEGLRQVTENLMGEM